MRRNILLYSLIIAICLFGSTTSFAGNGKVSMKGKPPVPGDGLKARINILDGTPVTISGIVYDATILCGGIELRTETDTVRVYDIGPIWYWKALGVNMPVVGDTVTVTGYQVTLSDESVITIAMTITVNGVEVTLRNPETGLPLWRKHPLTSEQ